MWEMLQHDFLRHALKAAIVAGVSLAYVGVYVVLRRIVFMGAALAQLGAAGVGLGLLLGQPPVLMGTIAVFAGVAGFALLPADERRLSRENLLGAIYALASALALLFVAKSPVGEAHISALLFGDLLAVGHGEMEALAAVCFIALLVHWLGYHAFVAVMTDAIFAHSVGVKVRWTEWAFYLSLGILVSACLRAIGALVVFAFLVLPPLAGLLWARCLRDAFLIAVAVAFLSAFIGLWFSYAYDLPAGPSVVTVCGVVALLAGIARSLCPL